MVDAMTLRLAQPLDLTDPLLLLDLTGIAARTTRKTRSLPPVVSGARCNSASRI
jgi:hypothetical protein